MLDTARAAAMSDPVANWQFVRPWEGPPACNRKGPGRDTWAYFGKLNLNDTRDYTAAQRTVARAMAHAERRVAEIERRAKALDAIGLRDASLRLGAIAATIRAEVLR